MCFSKKDITLYDDLSRPLELNNIDTSLWSDKCDYVDPSNCANLNRYNYNGGVTTECKKSAIPPK